MEHLFGMGFPLGLEGLELLISGGFGFGYLFWFRLVFEQ
jgi:hypothetical protein